MTEMLVFLAIVATAILVFEWWDSNRESREARKRNPRRMR